MQTLSLNQFMRKENLKRFSVDKPGPVYRRLCQFFPLQRLKNKKQHASSLIFLTKLSEYLQQSQSKSTQKNQQILDYLDALGLIVEEYERRIFTANLNKFSGAEMLEFLMEQQDLKQGDLAEELGSQSVVSDILSQKRKLNSQQIYALSQRFGVSPAVFFPT